MITVILWICFITLILSLIGGVIKMSKKLAFTDIVAWLIILCVATVIGTILYTGSFTL